MMAGRGRGRGRGLSINIEALGLGREEILPAVAHPPPLYPPLQFKPVPLPQSEDLDYILALKQELRESFHKLPFYIKAPNKVKDIERYSDKYQPGSNDTGSGWLPDWTRLPYELQEHSRKRVKVKRTKPNVKVSMQADSEDVSKLLEKLEQNDNKLETENVDANEDDEAKKEGEDEEDEAEEEYDEEDAEEETDYNQAYFDNGEDYGDDDEDDDEGPTY